MQDICPLCHETLHVTTDDLNAQPNQNQAQNHVQNEAEADVLDETDFEEVDEDDEYVENELRQLMPHEHQD